MRSSGAAADKREIKLFTTVTANDIGATQAVASERAEADEHCVADRMSVLVNGRIIATDKPLEIRKNSDVIRAYLGEEAAA